MKGIRLSKTLLYLSAKVDHFSPESPKLSGKQRMSLNTFVWNGLLSESSYW